MVRLGGKSNPRTDALLERNQKSTFRVDRREIDDLKSTSEDHVNTLNASFTAYISSNVQNDDIFSHIEFEDPVYYEAFCVPQSSDGMIQVGKKGRAVGKHYLLDQWCAGWDAGIFKNHPHILQASEIWNMSLSLRTARLGQWEQAIWKEQVEHIADTGKQYNDCQSRLYRKFNEKVSALLKTKRIIGCTTTAAAKYGDNIQAATPGILLVEEAGEILESHVLTSMGKHANQLILIGDHQYVNVPVTISTNLTPLQLNLQAAPPKSKRLQAHSGKGQWLRLEQISL